MQTTIVVSVTTEQEVSAVNRLREVRLAAGLTQFDLAAKADVALTAIVNFEHERTEPQLKTARKLAATLGVTVDYLWPTVAPVS